MTTTQLETKNYVHDIVQSVMEYLKGNNGDLLEIEGIDKMPVDQVIIAAWVLINYYNKECHKIGHFILDSIGLQTSNSVLTRITVSRVVRDGEAGFNYIRNYGEKEPTILPDGKEDGFAVVVAGILSFIASDDGWHAFDNLHLFSKQSLIDAAHSLIMLDARIDCIEEMNNGQRRADYALQFLRAILGAAPQTSLKKLVLTKGETARQQSIAAGHPFSCMYKVDR